jgi:hypothetical protein
LVLVELNVGGCRVFRRAAYLRSFNCTGDHAFRAAALALPENTPRTLAAAARRMSVVMESLLLFQWLFCDDVHSLWESNPDLKRNLLKLCTNNSDSVY